MAYDNSRYTYSQVLGGIGHFEPDTSTVSDGVLVLQNKLNIAGFWSGTPDGKFGPRTEEAVEHFQREYNFTVDKIVDQEILLKLNEVCVGRTGFSLTPGTYGVRYDEAENCLLYNQMVVYNILKEEGLSDIAIAGIMGNLEAEHEFRTAWTGDGDSVGICQWKDNRKLRLESFATEEGMDVTSIYLQAKYILAECTTKGYLLTDAESCLNYLKDTSLINTVQKAADYFTALYERCHSWDTWAQVEADSEYETSRFSTVPNEYNGRYYLDAAKRRGYAAAYLACIRSM